MREEWRAVVGLEGFYEVSDLGRVRCCERHVRFTHARTGQEHFRLKRQRVLSTQMQNAGYLIVNMHADNVRAPRLVHRLVAEAFIGPAPEGLDVNHKDGNKLNNAASNLEWLTRRENHLHAVAGGKYEGRAQRVRCPKTGREFDSIAQAARASNKAHRTVRRLFERL